MKIEFDLDNFTITYMHKDVVHNGDPFVQELQLTNMKEVLNNLETRILTAFYNKMKVIEAGLTEKVFKKAKESQHLVKDQDKMEMIHIGFGGICCFHPFRGCVEGKDKTSRTYMKVNKDYLLDLSSLELTCGYGTVIYGFECIDDEMYRQINFYDSGEIRPLVSELPEQTFFFNLVLNDLYYKVSKTCYVKLSSQYKKSYTLSDDEVTRDFTGRRIGVNLRICNVKFDV